MSSVGRNLKSDHSSSNPLHGQGCQLIRYFYDEVQELWFSHWLSSSTGQLKMWKTKICLLSNWMRIWKNDYNWLQNLPMQKKIITVIKQSLLIFQNVSHMIRNSGSLLIISLLIVLLAQESQRIAYEEVF